LLGLASIEARGVEQFAPVDMGKLAGTVVDALEEHRSHVELRTDGDTRVRGDEAWLVRAVSNLLDNALVHSGPGSSVTVEVARTGDDVLVKVRNEGSVPAHVRQRAFRRFATTRADKGGTGLGLAIVRAVAEAHGGRAELVETGPPTVEFALRLPASRRTAAVRDAPVVANKD